ncbi:MAG: ABC transporter substrate-binding protein [Chloroflexi bacterium]|nr:MAG: ABC transporter substrate-binding protein [Chloroflexota bacterium]
MKRTTIFLVVLVTLSLLLGACQPAATQAPAKSAPAATQAPTEAPAVEPVATEAPADNPVVFERSETLYTSGTQWGPPSSWNPFNGGGYAMGTIGLVYETLYTYDPLADKFAPWLAAADMTWADEKTMEVKLREGLTWSDGQPLTADDVKFTFELADPNGAYKASLNYVRLWNFLASVEKVDDVTVHFKFNETPYQEIGVFFYQTPIVPKHLWETKDVADITGGANEKGVGSGPYLFESNDQSRQVLVRNENWWGIEAFGKAPAPKRIVDIVNGSNNVALGLVLQGGLDLSNNFLPGVASLVKGGYGVQTYYPEAPYMVSANVATLIINEQVKPLDDVNFRRALAYSIDVSDIVENDYTGLVRAADPTGMMPTQDKYIDKEQLAELGWTYDPEKAKQILAAAGYKDVDSDGFVEAPDGSKIALKVTCPSGWTDWMAAIQIISKGAKAAGMNIEPDYPTQAAWRDAQLQGTFELSIQNEAQMSSTIFNYYNWIFQNPPTQEHVAAAQFGNYGLYDSPEGFALLNELGAVSLGDDEKLQEIASKLQKITLTDVPTIPLWYNGLWAQYSNAVWTNWPSAAEDANHYLPASWRGYWNLSGIQMLMELEPAVQE